MIDCRLFVDGVRFADAAAALAADAPTALAEVEVIWGRSTTVDQPEPATGRFVVMDPSGGIGFLDLLPIGAVLEIRAGGDIATGANVDFAVDGSFETLAVGPAGDRVEGAGTPMVTTATVAHGTKSIDTAGGSFLIIPPAAFDMADPAAWDTIPPVHQGQVWDWAIRVRAAPGVAGYAMSAVFAAPSDTGATVAGATAPWSATSFDWITVSGTTTIGSGLDGQWLGVYVNLTDTDPPWTSPPTTWADTPGSWADWGTLWVDRMELFGPADQLIRDVLVFSGRVTDMSATVMATDGTLRVEVTATDQMADLMNRYVGSTPWPAEPMGTRVGKILAAAEADVDVLIDDPLAGLVVSWRDVDSQPAGGLLSELAAGTDGVLWSATHVTTGPFLWIENPSLRASLGTLQAGGRVRRDRRRGPRRTVPGRTVIDGCQIADMDVTWLRDVSDVITRVDATWLEQTTPPTERTVSVRDVPAEGDFGARRMGVTTPLTTAPDATNVANRVLVRSRMPHWRAEALTWDLGYFPPPPGDTTAEALNLLDGTIRLGRALIFEHVPHWPGDDPVAAMYLDGGRYQYDGAWSLELAATPMVGIGESAGWANLAPGWTWAQMDPAIDWSDMWGVTGPVALLEGT